MEKCIKRRGHGFVEDVDLVEFLHDVIQDEASGLGVAARLLEAPGVLYDYNSETVEFYESFEVTDVGALEKQIAGRATQGGGETQTATIGRAHVAGGQGHVDELTVAELMAENKGFEASAWEWCRAMARTGYHDDSDYGSAVIVMYVALDATKLVEQMERWRALYPGLVDEGPLG